MIHLDKVTLSYGATTVLKDVDLTVAAGDFVCILGPSGCGKSSLLRLMAGLVNPSTGSLTRSTGRLSMVFQEPRLLPWLTVRENTLLPLRLTGDHAADPRGVLSDVQLWDHRDLYPHHLSGGMKQRNAIARALMTSPELLLMDEPFSALDEVVRFRLEELLRALWEARRQTVIFVTHSIAQAVFLGERILVMGAKNGRWIGDLRVPSAPRGPDLRTSSQFNETVRHVSRWLVEASS